MVKPQKSSVYSNGRCLVYLVEYMVYGEILYFKDTRDALGPMDAVYSKRRNSCSVYYSIFKKIKKIYISQWIYS